MGQRRATDQRGWSARSPRAAPPATKAEQAALRACALCGRETRGFGYTRRLRWDAFPSYRFCSLECCDAGGALAQRSNGVINTTPMETQAVKDARRSFAAVLLDLGLMAPFAERTSAEIDRIIEACVDGFQASMRRQAAAGHLLDDAVPF
jgi:Family of unknown function (DUF6511)